MTDEFPAARGLHSIHGAMGCAATEEREAMSYEKIFEYDLDITGVTDYGADMEALFTGRQSVPPQGAQFDVTLAGPVKGRVSGAMRGIDYLRVRPDGRRELELRGAIETDDGNRIAFSAEGVGTPREGEPIVDLAVKIDLLTAAGAYAWVNAKPAWGRVTRTWPATKSTSTSICTEARAADRVGGAAQTQKSSPDR
jgi:Protein of unknown function (DUF3237)